MDFKFRFISSATVPSIHDVESDCIGSEQGQPSASVLPAAPLSVLNVNGNHDLSLQDMELEVSKNDSVNVIVAEDEPLAAQVPSSVYHCEPLPPLLKSFALAPFSQNSYLTMFSASDVLIGNNGASADGHRHPNHQRLVHQVSDSGNQSAANSDDLSSTGSSSDFIISSNNDNTNLNEIVDLKFCTPQSSSQMIVGAGRGSGSQDDLVATFRCLNRVATTTSSAAHHRRGSSGNLFFVCENESPPPSKTPLNVGDHHQDGVFPSTQLPKAFPLRTSSSLSHLSCAVLDSSPAPTIKTVIDRSMVQQQQPPTKSPLISTPGSVAIASATTAGGGHRSSRTLGDMEREMNEMRKTIVDLRLRLELCYEQSHGRFSGGGGQTDDLEIHKMLLLLEKENSSLREKISQLEEDLQRALETYPQLVAEVNAARAAKVANEETNHVATTTSSCACGTEPDDFCCSLVACQRCADQKAEVERKLTQLTDEKAALVLLVSQLRDNEQVTGSTINSLHAKNSSLEEVLKTERQKLSALSSQVETARETATTHISTLEDQLVVVNKELEAERQLRQQSTSDFQTKHTAFAKKEASLNLLVEKLRLQLSQNVEEIARLQTELSDKGNMLQTAKQTAAWESEELKRRFEELEAAKREEVSLLENKVKALTCQLAQLSTVAYSKDDAPSSTHLASTDDCDLGLPRSSSSPVSSSEPVVSSSSSSLPFVMSSEQMMTFLSSKHRSSHTKWHQDSKDAILAMSGELAKFTKQLTVRDKAIVGLTKMLQKQNHQVAEDFKALLGDIKNNQDSILNQSTESVIKGPDDDFNKLFCPMTVDDENAAVKKKPPVELVCVSTDVSDFDNAKLGEHLLKLLRVIDLSDDEYALQRKVHEVQRALNGCDGSSRVIKEGDGGLLLIRKRIQVLEVANRFLNGELALAYSQRDRILGIVTGNKNVKKGCYSYCEDHAVQHQNLVQLTEKYRRLKKDFRALLKSSSVPSRVVPPLSSSAGAKQQQQAGLAMRTGNFDESIGNSKPNATLLSSIVFNREKDDKFSTQCGLSSKAWFSSRKATSLINLSSNNDNSCGVYDVDDGYCAICHRKSSWAQTGGSETIIHSAFSPQSMLQHKQPQYVSNGARNSALLHSSSNYYYYKVDNKCSSGVTYIMKQLRHAWKRLGKIRGIVGGLLTEHKIYEAIISARLEPMAARQVCSRCCCASSALISPKSFEEPEHLLSRGDMKTLTSLGNRLSSTMKEAKLLEGSVLELERRIARHPSTTVQQAGLVHQRSESSSPCRRNYNTTLGTTATFDNGCPGELSNTAARHLSPQPFVSSSSSLSATGGNNNSTGSFGDCLTSSEAEQTRLEMTELFAEIQTLKDQLQRAIQTNSALKTKLEEQVAGGSQQQDTDAANGSSSDITGFPAASSSSTNRPLRLSNSSPCRKTFIQSPTNGTATTASSDGLHNMPSPSLLGNRHRRNESGTGVVVINSPPPGSDGAPSIAEFKDNLTSVTTAKGDGNVRPPNSYELLSSSKSCKNPPDDEQTSTFNFQRGVASTKTTHSHPSLNGYHRYHSSSAGRTAQSKQHAAMSSASASASSLQRRAVHGSAEALNGQPTITSGTRQPRRATLDHCSFSGNNRNADRTRGVSCHAAASSRSTSVNNNNNVDMENGASPTSLGGRASSSSTSDLRPSSTLFAVGRLEEYEHLKREIEESFAILRTFENKIKARLAVLVHQQQQHILSYSVSSPAIQALAASEALHLKELQLSGSELRVCLNQQKQLTQQFTINQLPPINARGKFVDVELLSENTQLIESVTHWKGKYEAAERLLRTMQDRLEQRNRAKEAAEGAIYHRLVNHEEVLNQVRHNLQRNLGCVLGHDPSSHPIRPLPDKHISVTSSKTGGVCG